MTTDELIALIQRRVADDPSVSGELHRAITRAFQQAVPMVGTLPHTLFRFKNKDTGWSMANVKVFHGLGKVLAGGTARCLYGAGIYMVDSGGAYYEGDDGAEWTEQEVTAP